MVSQHKLVSGWGLQKCCCFMGLCGSESTLYFRHVHFILPLIE